MSAKRPGHLGSVVVGLAVVGPLVYVLAVVLGGFLWPGYSHSGESISTLTSTGAPNQSILLPLFAIYNLCVLALAAGLHDALPSRRWGLLGPGFLAGAAATGLLVLAVPQGPWSDPLSGTGVAHTALAGVDALCFLLALAFLAPRMRSVAEWSRLGSGTWGFLIAGVVAGGFGAVSVTAAYAGLAERVSIGVFLLWTQWAAIELWRRRVLVPPERMGRPASVPVD